MWKYMKPYLHYAVIAAIFMVGEVMTDLLQPELMSRIVDEGVLGIYNNHTGDMRLILMMGLMMIGIAVFGGLCGSSNNIFVHMSAQNIGNDMRKDCFTKIMSFSFPQMDYYGTGSLVTRVTNDITQVQNFVAQFVRGMIRMAMLTSGSIFFMFRLNRQFGLIVLCAFPLILCCMIFCICKAGPLLPKMQAQLDKINDILQEDVSGIRVIKACVREIYEKRRFGKANDELMKTQLRVLVIFALMNPVMNALMYIVIILVMLAGSFQVKAGTTTPGTIMAAITYTTQLLSGILMLVMLFQSITKGVASWKRIKEILSAEPELKDGESGKTQLKDVEGKYKKLQLKDAEGESKDSQLKDAVDKSAKSAACGRIEFKDVSFAFPNTGQMVLKHINLVINPGETIAVMGATGCGKTALVNLIPRFYDVTEGAVFVDGVDVRNYGQKELRSKVVSVLQKSELFSVSVKDNS